MTIYQDTNSKPLLDLLDRIRSGVMVLPDFQRDFVWEPSATQALIVSIANSYPAGSISRTIIDDTLPGGPVERTITYEAPFDRCDRVGDYRVVWGYFEKQEGNMP
jgi:hypothetical protein